MEAHARWFPRIQEAQRRFIAGEQLLEVAGDGAGADAVARANRSDEREAVCGFPRRLRTRRQAQALITGAPRTKTDHATALSLHLTVSTELLTRLSTGLLTGLCTVDSSLWIDHFIAGGVKLGQAQACDDRLFTGNAGWRIASCVVAGCSCACDAPSSRHHPFFVLLRLPMIHLVLPT